MHSFNGNEDSQGMKREKKHNMNEASTESNERRKKIVSNKFSASISLFILHSSAE